MKTGPDVSTGTERAGSLQALSGIRVVTIAVNLPGPVCARRLADYGASVVKIEPPARLGGDPLQAYAPDYYRVLHAGIPVQSIDLKNDRRSFDALLSSADVLLTSQREPALERLGLGWSTLSAAFPHLCHIAIVGSIDNSHAGHDLTYVTDAGLATPPQLPSTLVADLGGAERAVAATFAALRMRDRSDCGQQALIALEDAANAFAAPIKFGLTAADQILRGGHPGYNFYPARDGWVALAALEPHFVSRVEAASGVPFTSPDLSAYFSLKPCTHWAAWAAQHDIPLSVISNANQKS
jgi:crotonobetainyl-CoA:carnitine CoA-transferase CaiB-like acyl-CoA transferase